MEYRADYRVLWAGALALLASTVSCASPSGDEDDPPVEIDEERPLDLTVDRVDVDHGAVRVHATMVEGSAEVAVLLGDACDHREVGRGIATRVALVWRLDDAEAGDALRCGLVVRGRVHAGPRDDRRADRRRVFLVASLDVSAEVAPVEADDGEGGPQLRELTTAADDVHLAFASRAPAGSLVVGDARIAPLEGDDDDGVQRFDVPYTAFARAVIDDRPLRVDSAPFSASVSIGGVALDRDVTGVVAQPEVDEVQEVDQLRSES